MSRWGNYEHPIRKSERVIPVTGDLLSKKQEEERIKEEEKAAAKIAKNKIS